MTALHLCPRCASGLVTASRCGNCGAGVQIVTPSDRDFLRGYNYSEMIVDDLAPNVAGAALHGEESPLPVVEGGQGREPEEIVSDAWGIVGTAALLAFVAAAFAVGVWAAGY